jgi:regulator of protease activity HflC (stomatin/prohibitin superfamily)
LKKDEQLVLEWPSDREARNGPSTSCFPPLICKAVKRKAILLDVLEYAIVTDTLTGEQRSEAGPQLLFPGAYESVGRTLRKTVLEKEEYVKILNSETGEIRVVSGPAAVVPKPTESIPNGVQKAASLKKYEYVRITDSATGVLRVERGEKLVIPGPTEVFNAKETAFQLKRNEYVKLIDTATGAIRVEVGEQLVFPVFTETAPEGIKQAVSLKKNEFVRLTDSATGEMRIERGEKLVFPRPMEAMDKKMEAFSLRKNQYIKLFDTATGVIRVEVGEQIVFPNSTESVVTPISEAVNVDHETAVLVVNKESGQQRLITESGLFVPAALDDILDVRKLIRVEPHEVAIVRDNEGNYTFHIGASKGGKGTAFFLQPHCEVVTMYWSSGTSKENLEKGIITKVIKPIHKVPVTKIDLRAQYAFFEYNVRTSDNVELILEGLIFWQITDVPRMIQATGDPKGDVWYHARSALIQAVSRVTLETFMADIYSIVTQATPVNDDFYKERGVVVHNLEVTRYECSDQSTSMVLQEIIQETTNRINSMQQQMSANDVQKEELKGQIELEKQRSELIQAKSDNDRVRAVIEGEADGLRLAKNTEIFLKTLSQDIPDAAARLTLFQFFQEQHMSTRRTEHLASGNASLFLTPEDMNLKLNMKSCNGN